MEIKQPQFRYIFAPPALVALIVMLLLVLFSGCRMLRWEKSDVKDSASVNDTKEGSVRVDSSGSKSDKTNTKETVYYPQPIYIEGKNGAEPKIIFMPQSVKETGTERTEQAQIIKDTSWKEAFNSLTELIASKETEKKTTVFPAWGLWVGLGLLVLLLLKNVLPFTIIKK